MEAGAEGKDLVGEQLLGAAALPGPVTGYESIAFVSIWSFGLRVHQNPIIRTENHNRKKGSDQWTRLRPRPDLHWGVGEIARAGRGGRGRLNVLERSELIS